MSKTITCWDPNCSAVACMSDRQHQHHMEHGTTFYCAAGHKNVFRPSEIKKLRENLGFVERERDRWRRWYEEEQARWKCPFADCYYTCAGKGALARHINAAHQRTPERRQLAADAGPDALNTTVH